MLDVFVDPLAIGMFLETNTVELCCALQCYAMLCHAIRYMLRYAMLCVSMSLCDAMLCYVVQTDRSRQASASE